MMNNEYEIKTIQLPNDYDIDVYKMRKALDKVKLCPYCNSDNIQFNYYNSSFYFGDTIFEAIPKAFSKTKTNTIECTCKDCGAKYSISFETSKKCKKNLERIITDYDCQKTLNAIKLGSGRKTHE